MKNLEIATTEQLHRLECLELERLVNRPAEQRRAQRQDSEAMELAKAAVAVAHKEREARLAAQKLLRQGTCGVALAGLALLLGLAGAWPLALISAAGCGWAVGR